MKQVFTARILRFLAKISYPLYLTHLAVVAAMPGTSNPAVTTAELLLGSVALATVTHDLVEAPLMQMGKYYSRHLRPGFALKRSGKVSF
jgi:peptidoglycan/LPS O-acetylase OafA/YrhL